MKKLLFAALVLLFPFSVFAGSASFTSPGSYGFTIPQYDSLTVTVNGAGGGGGGSNAGTHRPRGGNGTAGGASTFSSLTGGGGGGGTGGFFTSGAPGTSGSGSGGDTNTTGGGAAGGSGGNSSWADGGDGGNGGKVVKSYTTSNLTAGDVVTIIVGGGGAGGAGGDTYVPNGSNGSNGSVSITWTDPPPASCSVWFDSNPIAYGGGTTLHWSSSNANQWLYINNIGYVGGSGATWVGPLSTTDYSCEAYGGGGTDGWHSAVLYVNAPASCSWSGGTVAHGASVTAYQSSTVPYGSSCASQTRTCNNGSLSGSYAYASCTVTAPPISCSLSLSPSTITQGQSATLSWTSTNATGGSISPTVGSVPPSGSASVTPSQTTTYTGSFSGLAGSAACDGGAGKTLTRTCAPLYSCSGNTIQYTNTSCQTSNVTTCIAPAYCSPGSSVCLNPPPSFNSFTGTYNGVSFAASGHLQVRPQLVRSGDTTHIYWNVSNVRSCAVSENSPAINDAWTTSSSGSSGKVSSALNQQTIYTLSCTGLDSSTINETQVVNIAPIFQEL